MCLFALNILEIIALDIYDENNFDPSHTFHRMKKMNMKDVVLTVMTDTYTCFVLGFCFWFFFWGGGLLRLKVDMV